MHNRAAKPTGAVKRAAAIAIEIMILLSIDLRIAQVRPRVEKSVQRLAALTHVLPARCSVRCPQRIGWARSPSSAERADSTAFENGCWRTRELSRLRPVCYLSLWRTAKNHF